MRSYAHTPQPPSDSLIHRRMRELVPERVAEVKAVRAKLGSSVIDQVTVEKAYAGLRGIKCMTWETSILDEHRGICYRGLTISEMRQRLPKPFPAAEEPSMEALLWLLLTGEVPTPVQAASLAEDLKTNADIPRHTLEILPTLARSGLHIMSQLSAGLASMQSESRLARRYASLGKADYWPVVLEDIIAICAKLPVLCALLFRHNYLGGAPHENMASLNRHPDVITRFCHLIGHGDRIDLHDCIRLYGLLHADHEGGNVSAHACRLVGSALSDPYLAMASAVNGLAGPLHGLANQDVMIWISAFRERVGTDNPTNEQVAKALWDTLNSGKVVPGYGHAVLRTTDPRYTAFREFALKHLADFPLFHLVGKIYEVAPEVLTQHGKTKNPWPNVDAHSGCVLAYYGLNQHDFHTVLFAMSRAFGILSSLVWDRAFGLPIERPKSVTTEWIKTNVKAG